MSLVEQYHREHIARRLRIAGRAVADEGIDLKRKPVPPCDIPAADNVIDFDIISRDAARIEAAIADGAPLSFLAVAAPVPPLTMRAIQRIVANFYGVSVVELCSVRRTGPLCYARHVAMYLCRHIIHRSFPEIARAFGGRDHTTALSAVRKIEKCRATDLRLDGDVRTLRAMLGGVA